MSVDCLPGRGHTFSHPRLVELTSRRHQPFLEGQAPKIASFAVLTFVKLSYVFKCLTDCVILDDFKTALDRLRAYKIGRLNSIGLADADPAVSNDIAKARERLPPDWSEAKCKASHVDHARPTDLEFGFREYSISGESSRNMSTNGNPRPVGSAF